MVKLPGWICVFACAFLALFSCRGETEEAGYREVGFGRAREMLSSANPPVVLDVRTPQEFTGELGHIPGARLVPLQNLSDSLGVLSDLKEREILVVCRTGRRSAIAGQRLAEAGFRRVYNFTGGMTSWKENGGRIEK